MAHTEQDRADALEAYIEHGTAEASRLTGVPVRTICRWAGEAGLAQAKREQTEAAREALSADIDERRVGIRDLLLQAAEVHARRSLEAKPREAQALATAAAIMLDKFRLEMGEHTQATRSESVGVAEAAKAKVDQLAARRRQKSA